MNNKIIYFDNAATSGKKPDGVIEAVCDCLKNANANPGRSSHSLSIKASDIIYHARELLGELFNIKSTENIVFTKNATEALNIAIYGSLSKGDEVLTTSMEHNSVLRPLNHLKDKGVIKLKILEADSNGLISNKQIEEAISKDTKLVTVTSASNVCGTKPDIAGICGICHEKGVKLLVDAAQGGGTIVIDLDKTPIDFLALTGHKHLFGPQGTGALIIKSPNGLRPLMRGGTGSQSESITHPEFLPDKFEAGTPNTPGLSGLAQGIRFILNKGIKNIIDYEKQLTNLLLERLLEIKEIEVYAPEADRTGIISFNVNGFLPSDVSQFLDSRWGICSRPGLHCAPLAHRSLNTFPNGTVRFSLSYFNTEEEIKIAIEAVKALITENQQTF